MNSLAIRQNDYGYDLTFTVQKSDGTLFDLTGVTSVRFKAVNADNFRTKVNQTALIVSPPTNGQVKYTVQDGDFDEEGNFKGGLTLIYAGSKSITTRDFFITVLKTLVPNS